MAPLSPLRPAKQVMLALIIDRVALDHVGLRLALKSLRCEVISVSNLAQARKVLRKKSLALILCERDLLDGNWRELLLDTTSPLLIVTSRLADECLWSEVLYLGGFDVLAKPFDEIEVMRVLEYALQRACRTRDGRACRTLAVYSSQR
jgi:DNA-binding response OmpR family regulator